VVLLRLFFTESPVYPLEMVLGEADQRDTLLLAEPNLLVPAPPTCARFRRCSGMPALSTRQIYARLDMGHLRQVYERAHPRA
jgi:hypothetical protein